MQRVQSHQQWEHLFKEQYQTLNTAGPCLQRLLPHPGTWAKMVAQFVDPTGSYICTLRCRKAVLWNIWTVQDTLELFLILLLSSPANHNRASLGPEVVDVFGAQVCRAPQPAGPPPHHLCEVAGIL